MSSYTTPTPTLAIAPDKPALELQLFGAFVVRCEGRPLPKLRSRKELWLLAILALAGTEKPIERSRLAGMLWPEALESRALANLRRSLTVLRDALGSQAGRIESPTPRTLRFDLTDATCDVLDFDRAVRRGDDASLKRAVELYRGPLLEACFETWIMHEREAREQAALAALQTLADRAKQNGNVSESATLLRRVLLIDPLRETALRAWMEALADMGNHAAAGEVYRAFRVELRRSLNAEPDAETVQLSRAINAAGRRRAEPSPARENVEQTSTADRPAYQLPAALSSLVGRQAEREAVILRLRTARLVTLTGPGGVGKTRLSIAVAEAVCSDFDHGVCFVDLSLLGDPLLLPIFVLNELGVTEPVDKAAMAALEEFLRPKRMLLLLDNCEHLLSDCARVSQGLLRKCPHLRILTTSREALRAPAEVVWPVPSLVPDEAKALFAERAAQARFTFRMTEANTTAADRVCRRLEGIPLAIEMAAARTRGMSVPQIAADLDDVVSLLNQRGAQLDPRQETLRATLDWSYRLLDDRERALLTRLSVFAGGWTLSTMEYICSGKTMPKTSMPDIVLSLVEKSLVEFSESADGDGRYRLLETTRAYASEMLAPEIRARLCDRHADYFALQAQFLKHMQGSPSLTEGAFLIGLETELPNIRAALGWCLNEGSAECGLRIAGMLWKFWWVRGHITEGRRHIAAALERESDEPDYAPTRAVALRAGGILAYFQWDFPAAQRHYEEALACSRALGEDGDAASVLLNLGLLFTAQEDLSSARRRLLEALEMFRALDSQHCVQKCLHSLADIAVIEGDLAGAKANYEEALRHYEEIGDLHNVAVSCFALASVFRKSAIQDPATAELSAKQERAYVLRSLTIFSSLCVVAGTAECLEVLANLAIRQGSFNEVARLHAAARALRESADGTRLGDAESVVIDDEIARARAVLGDSVFDVLWAEGRAMTMDQSVEYALRD